MGLQSTLGEGDIADELAESQRQISIAEFFEKNKQMLGFDSEARALVTAVKEAVDNSLTWSTPFVYQRDGETRHEPIGAAVDDLIEENREDVIVKRDGDLEKLRVDGMNALSFDQEYDVDFQSVSSVFRHRVNSDIYRITVEGGREVELTDYHSVFVLRDGEVVSVETSDIGEDDYVVLPDTEWGDGATERIDLVSELLDLPPERTEAIGLYGVEELIEERYDEIWDQADEQYRMSDYRKCDRLPLNVVRKLDLEVGEYEDCEIGVRFGRHNIPAVLTVDDELAELLGLYAAEGCITGGDTDHEKVYLSLGSHETNLIDHAEDLVESVFGVPPSTVSAHESATNVTIPSKIVGFVMSRIFEVGSGASEKRIPRFVFDFPDAHRERFALGYAAGDGYPTEAVIPVLCEGDGLADIEEYRLSLSTKSDRLSSGLRYLLSSIGYDTTHEHQPAETRWINGRKTEFEENHLLYVRTNQSSTSIKKLPAEHVLEEVDDAKLAYNLERRQDRVETDHALALADGGELEFQSRGRRVAEGDLTALPVTKVERIEYDGEWVYDVSVPGDENFMAGTAPLACHNSLDATEEAGFLPDIYVEIKEERDYYTLIVEDNGPGITKEQIPNIFGKLLYGSRFGARAQSLTPDQQLLVRRGDSVEFVPIGVLCDAYLPQGGEATRPVPAGIEVPSFDRGTHEMTWQPVTHAIRHETEERTYEITTEKGRTVEVTGNHSLFSVTANGETKEVNAGELDPGDTVLAPKRLPQFEETTEEVNLLKHLSATQLEDRRVYVYGFEEGTLRELKNGEKIRKKPSQESDRKRTYYRYDGVDVLKDSLENNYLEKGYLPAETVIELGWEERASDCEFRTYQVGGDETSIPVTAPLSPEFVKLLGYYISEGHAGPRQVGFTFGAHEDHLIEATEEAVVTVGGETTTVERERNSTRVKAVGSPLAMFLSNVCGDHADEKRVPEFIFHASPERQGQFIAALYQGDGCDSYPDNELSHATTSETLARQLSVLWNMQGVLASTETTETTDGYAPDSSTVYRTKVYGEDVSVAGTFDEADSPGEQRHKRIPTSVLEEVRVGEVHKQTVSDTIPGLLLGAGVGSSMDHAAVYQSLIEEALDGEFVTKPYYVHNLQEMGLLDGDHQPTETLTTLWEAVQNLKGITETDMCFLPVREVEETEPPEYVYDISVPGATGRDENFIVSNEGAVSVKNSRGQQGIGISAAVMYAQLTSGTPAKITSRTPSRDTARYFELIIDTENNEPDIKVDDTTTWERPHGTRIELRMEANMRARRQLHDYITHTAVVNPHARIELVEPDAEFKFDRATDELPAETEEIRPHPHGVELGTVIKMLDGSESYSLSGFLQEEFTRVGGKTADDILDAFRDRHFGREMGWFPPRATEAADLEAAIADAVANKSAEATAAFADRVADRVGADAPVTRSALEGIVGDVAGAIETEFDTTFGATVREKSTAAAWGALTADRAGRLYELVDSATTDRKDDPVVRGFTDRLASKFDGADRDRATRQTVRAFVDRAADMTEERDDATFGDTARENVTGALWSAMGTVPEELPNVGTVAGDRDAAADFVDAMRSIDVMAPPTDCLSPIRAELVEEGLRKEFDADFYTAETRDAEVHGGDPFIIEAGIAYGGELENGEADLMRFANRVPLVYQRGACAITDVIRGIDWRNYELDQPGGSGMPGGPVVLLVHVASTNVPFTSESKDAVANVPAIEKEIELAVREAARDLKSHLKRRRSLEKRRRKQTVIADILPTMGEKLAAVTDREEPDVDAALARIMNNVLVTRGRENGRIELTVENNTNAGVDLDVTEIVSAEPAELSDGTPVEMDGEWYVKWDPEVGAGEEATLTYRVDGDADVDVTVDGLESEKLTVDA
jgi:DNA topoisomerase-6 subunit B